MENRFFRKHIVISTIISIVSCFLISIVVGQLIGGVVGRSLGLNDQSIAGKYILESIGKIFAIGVALLLICVAGFSREIKIEHGHLRKCRVLILFMCGVAVYNVVGDAIANRGIAFTQFHLDALIACALYAFATGLLEELVCRILLFQNMFEKWRTRPYGVWKAILASSVIFGASHLLNLPAGVSATLFQVYYATIAGIIFAVMYLFGRNIWVCIVSHSFIDFGGAVGYAFMPNDRAMELSATMSGIDIGMIVIVAAMTACAVYALAMIKYHYNQKRNRNRIF